MLRDSLEERTLIDVRSPAEFQKAHIPSAVNIPLFSDEERAIVGTTYKKENPQNAMLKGLDFVGPKMSNFIREAEELAPNKKILVHCWRGGKRSQSMAWLLGMAGFDVQTLIGGYKAYRQSFSQLLSKNQLNLIVLGGKTGCGKTAILQELKNKREQIIDLEELAHHKGSAFGWIGEPNQPSTEQFENNLYETIIKLDLTKRIWVENESKGIGSVYLPSQFWDQMKSSALINIELPFDIRVAHLVDVYASKFNKEDLINSFQKIKKRLGGLALKNAIDALEADDYHTATTIALNYYDKTYQYNLEKNKTPTIYHLRFSKLTPSQNANALITFANKHIQLIEHG